MKTIHCVLSASFLSTMKVLAKNADDFSQAVEKGEV